ncbi:MAG: flagellar assembly protein FliW, partial [Candidatus Schekmanbacteria bacterium]
LLVVPDYKIKLSKNELKSLHANSLEELEVYTIITIPDNPKEMTINLLGPIILNKEKNRAKQIVLEKSPYSTKHKMIN